MGLELSFGKMIGVGGLLWNIASWIYYITAYKNA